MFVVPSEAAARALILADLVEAGNSVEPTRPRVFAAIDGNASGSKNVDVVARTRVGTMPQARSRCVAR
jgi:hypothetical protein